MTHLALLVVLLIVLLLIGLVLVVSHLRKKPGMRRKTKPNPWYEGPERRGSRDVSDVTMNDSQQDSE